MELEVTDAAKQKLVELGHQPEFGARPLRRTLQTELDNRLATLLLDGTLEAGDTIVADVGEDGAVRVALAGGGRKGGNDDEVVEAEGGDNAFGASVGEPEGDGQG